MGSDGPPQRNRRTKQGRYASQITLCEIQECFDLPSSKACVRLGVGLTVLKRLCRSFGIERWPYRLPGSGGKAAGANASGAATPAGSDSTAATRQAFSEARLPAEGSTRSGGGQATRALRPRTPAVRVLRDLLESGDSEGSASDDDEEWHAEGAEEGEEEEEEGAERDPAAPCQRSRLAQRQRGRQVPRRQPCSSPPAPAAAQQPQQATALSGDLFFGYVKQEPVTEGEASSPSGGSSAGRASAAGGAVPGPSQPAQRISVPLAPATSGDPCPAFLDSGAFLKGVRDAAGQLRSGSLAHPASPAPNQLLPGASWGQVSNAGSCPSSPVHIDSAWPDAVRGISLRDGGALPSPFCQAGPALAGFPGLQGPVWGGGPALGCPASRDAAAGGAQLRPAGSAVGCHLQELRTAGQILEQQQQLLLQLQQPARLASAWAPPATAEPCHGPVSEFGDLLQMWGGDDELDLPLPSPCGLALPAEAAPPAAPTRRLALAAPKLPPLGCVLHQPSGRQLAGGVTPTWPAGGLPALGAPALGVDALPMDDHPGAFFTLFPSPRDPSPELWH